ncbi:hypothetical protein N431DRAFT_498493 [Stipitochalara longipes BDJ]|nr:hypothetical protein N431DRAFT_498493 [Stipitochalara longipes BDJ]
MRKLITKPRRQHYKSRTGCAQCKKRKVKSLTDSKCDENKPTCNKCSIYGTSCSFLQTYPLKRIPSSTPITPLQTSTASPEPSISTFEHPFLMHELLSLSALHLAYERPNQAVVYKHAAASHHAKALPMFQEEVSNTGPENANVCFAFVTLMNIHERVSQSADESSNLFFGSESDRQSKFTHEMHWLRLYRGGRTFLNIILPWIENGPISALFKPFRELDPRGPTPMTLDEKTHLDSLAETWNKRSADQLLIPPEQKHILEETLQILRRIFSLSTANTEFSKHAATISWITMIPDEFVQLIEERVSEAILILAHYCVLLKRLEYMWRVKGKAESLLKAIIDEVGEGWDRWLKWPIDVIMGTKDAKTWNPCY